MRFALPSLRFGPDMPPDLDMPSDYAGRFELVVARGAAVTLDLGMHPGSPDSLATTYCQRQNFKLAPDVHWGVPRLPNLVSSFSAAARPDAGRRAPAVRGILWIALALAGASCQGRCGAHGGGGASASPSGSARLPKVCEQRPPNSVSDDAPVTRGVGESTPMLAWFEARGVAKGKVLDWLVAHQAGDRAWVDGQTAEQTCQTLRVGAPSEEAIFCEYVVRSDTMLAHGVAFVARGGRPVAVLDVGLGARAMDWPDMRNLDLAIAFAPDGLSAQTAERAPEGTKLVEPRALRSPRAVVRRMRGEARRGGPHA